MLKPLLKYAGSKRSHLNLIHNLFLESNKDRLLDLTAGGGYVPLEMARMYPNLEVAINDTDPSLIAFWKFLQKQKTFDYDLVQLDNPNLYYIYRDRFNWLRRHQPYSDELPQLYYYLNRWCHSGIMRYNGGGDFNTPLGNAYKKYTGLYDKGFQTYRNIVREWKITNLDYRDVLITNFDFVIFDPPYFQSKLAYYSRFELQDHLDAIAYLGSMKTPVVMFNSYNDQLELRYRKHGFFTRIVGKKYSCNADMDARSNKNPEIVAYKNIV